MSQTVLFGALMNIHVAATAAAEKLLEDSNCLTLPLCRMHLIHHDTPPT